MNEQIKQRLVGAVVLISLAVIFIPILLDGGNHSSMPRFGSNVPQQPDFDFEPLEIPLEPAPPSPQRPRVIETIEQAESMAIATVEEKPAPVPAKPAANPVSTPAPKLVTKSTEPAASKPLGGESVAWVVQVGSFGQSANAMALRDKLRKAGFKAFVETFSEGSKKSYRVRVGPELKRSTAEKHLVSLQQKMQIKGIIMGHP